MKKETEGQKIIVEDISEIKTSLGEFDINAYNEREKDAIKAQKIVDDYNDKVRKNEGVDPLISERNFVNGNIIVRLFKKDKVAPNPLLKGGIIPKENKITVQNPDTGRQSKVTDPLPYCHEGVIVNYDKSLRDRFGFIERGLQVQLEPFELRSKTFFPDKGQAIEFLTFSQLLDGATLPGFEGYFIISISDIESFK